MTAPAVHPLAEAFHTLYDLKDAAAARGDDEARLAAYEALTALRYVFEVEGVEMPRRFDGAGR